MDYIKRLEDECNELGLKIYKLESFIDSDFEGADLGSPLQGKLLNDQAKAMKVYHEILLDRLYDLQSQFK